MPNHKKYSSAEILIDAEDLYLLAEHSWTITQCGDMRYVRLIVSGKKVYLHRLLTGVSRGQLVDHRNLNGLDNRRENLRVCTKSQNMMNRSRQRNNTSGFKGVVFDKSRNKWKAQIKLNRKWHQLGRFECIDDAATAYNEASKVLHNDFARLNIL